MILSGSYKDNLLVQDTSPVPYIGYAKVYKVLVISAVWLGMGAPSVSIGAAHHAAAMGVPEDKIRRFGRWVFVCVQGLLTFVAAVAMNGVVLMWWFCHLTKPLTLVASGACAFYQ